MMIRLLLWQPAVFLNFPEWKQCRRKKNFYREAALKLLKALDEKHCDWTEKSDCFLTHCSGSYHGEQHNHTLVYADSFFLEAILKLKGTPFLLW